MIADAPPTASITTPASGLLAANGQRIDVTVRGTDDVGVTQVGFKARVGDRNDRGVVADAAGPGA